MDLFSSLLGLFGIALFVVTLLVNAAAKRWVAQKPELLRQAGIVRVDWWLGFYRGIWRLAFTTVGAGLTRRERLLLRAFWALYIGVFSAISLAQIFGWSPQLLA